MMHPDRERFLPYLLEHLGDTPVAMDRGKGIWDTQRRAWLMFEPDADHHLVVQDDVILCDDFLACVDEVLTEDMPYALYFGNRASMRERAAAALKCGHTDMKLRWSPAVVMPTRLILDFVKFGDAYGYEGGNCPITQQYLLSIGQKVRYPMPSLVDHRQGHTSLISGQPCDGRRAYAFKCGLTPPEKGA